MTRPTYLASPLALSSVVVLVAVVPERALAGIGSNVGSGIGNALVNSGLSIGAIIGISVGVIVLCVIIGLLRRSCQANAHAGTTTAIAVVPQPTPQPVNMTGILPNPPPPPGEYYPPMSPAPPMLPSVAGNHEAARPVTVEEYNRIYSQVGLSNSTSITTPASPGGATALPPSGLPAPSMYPSPAMTHTNTLGSPPSTVTSPYMGTVTSPYMGTVTSPYMGTTLTTAGNTTAVSSPYMTTAATPGNMGTFGGGSSSTQLASLQPAPAVGYPPLPAAPTLTQGFVPPSPNLQTPYPVMSTCPTVTSPPPPASLPTQDYNQGLPVFAEAATTAAPFNSTAVLMPDHPYSNTSAGTNPPLTTDPVRVRTVQYGG